MGTKQLFDPDLVKLSSVVNELRRSNSMYCYHCRIFDTSNDLDGPATRPTVVDIYVEYRFQVSRLAHQRLALLRNHLDILSILNLRVSLNFYEAASVVYQYVSASSAIFLVSVSDSS